MNHTESRTILFLVASAALPACVTVSDLPTMPQSVQPFSTEQAAQEYAEKLELWNQSRSWPGAFYVYETADGTLEELVVTATRAAAESITNNQEQGVDEGDIIKRVGDFLILLRRGRLFSFGIGSGPGEIAALDYIDVEWPNEDMDAWYDEILVYRDSIVLLGFSYDFGGSVIRRFRLGDDGALDRIDAYVFESWDYFDAENYATRLVNDQLIFYLPQEFSADNERVLAYRITEAGEEEFDSPFDETIYAPLQHSIYPIRHTVISCALDQPEFQCQARSLVGPDAQLFYISSDAFYLWLNSAEWAYDFFVLSNRRIERVARRATDFDGDDDHAVVYRLPHDGSAPTVVEVRGNPINQFSFRETATALQVFVYEWNDDGDAVEPAWLEVPLGQFSSQLTPLPVEFDHALPTVEGRVAANRFIGDYLLYEESGYDYEADEARSQLWVADLARPALPLTLNLEMDVERIEPFAENAVIIGRTTDSLAATTLSLADFPVAINRFEMDYSVQADERSHSFNYRWQEDLGGLFALPVVRAPEDEEYQYFGEYFDEPAVVNTQFVGVDRALNMYAAGNLLSNEASLEMDDQCVVSCVDWYGDSRPFFIDERVFALTGYELIEASNSAFNIVEIARADALELLTR